MAGVLLALLLLAPQDQIEKLIRALGSDDESARAAAAEQLRKLGEKARPALTAALQSKDPEVRTRAQALLLPLDRAVHRKTIEKHSGQIGRTGVFWVEKPAIVLLGDPLNTPEWMREPLMKKEAAIAMIDMDAKAVQHSELVMLRYAEEITVASDGSFHRGHNVEIEHWWRISAGNGSQSFSARHGWDRTPREFRGAEFFRSWKRLRSASIVFVSTADRYGAPKMREGLEKGLEHKNERVRGAAVAALSAYYTEAVVALTVKMLDDKSALVRSAARRTLERLVGGERDEAKQSAALRVNAQKVVTNDSKSCRCKENK